MTDKIITPMNWNKVGIDKTKETHPRAHELVWIYDMDDEISVGYWDNGWWCLWTGSDDIYVVAWAPISYPDPPDFINEWLAEIVKSWEND